MPVVQEILALESELFGWGRMDVQTDIETGFKNCEMVTEYTVSTYDKTLC